MKTGRSLIFLLIILSSCNSDHNTTSPIAIDQFSSNKADIKAYNLISAQEASTRLEGNPEIYIPIHVSQKEAFLKEHIPNALNIWRPDYGSDVQAPYGGLIPSHEKLQSLLQGLGFQEGKTLLLYDLKANVDALRFAWVLNLYGFDEFKIINGGLKNWKINDLPISHNQLARPAKSNYLLKESFDKSILADAGEVLAAIKDTNTILIDTREDYEYKALPFVHNGEVLPFKKGAFHRGSIPSAKHLNWSRLADLDGDHRIKSEKDLRYDLSQLKINPSKKIILYCQSGSRTSHTFYVLKHVLGFPEVKNYDGSWIEWSYLHSENKEYAIQQISSEEQFETKYNSLKKTLSTNE